MRRRLWLLATASCVGLLGFGLTSPTSAQGIPGPIVEFKIPTAASGAYGITTGADGNLWFTETAKNKIGKVSPTGKVIGAWSLFDGKTTDHRPTKET